MYAPATSHHSSTRLRTHGCLLFGKQPQLLHRTNTMSDEGYDIGASASANDDAGGWSSAPTKKDDLAIALEKEKIIKDIMQTQEGLKALLSRIEEVTNDISKTTEENATLQTYLDNMTRNTAMFAGQKGK